MPYHENIPTSEVTFIKEKNEVFEAFLEVRNPFQENGNSLIHIISRYGRKYYKFYQGSYKHW